MEIKRNGNIVEFDIEISHDELEEAMEKVYRRERKHFSLPGFRQGRVPRQLLEANYGSGLFFEDAVNEILPERYADAVEENDLQLASEPTIDIEGEYKKGEPVVLNVSVEVTPEFEVEGYEDIELEKIIPEVQDEMIDAQIEQERSQHGRMSVVEDRAVEDGDNLIIDFVGTVDGEEFEGGSADDFELTIGSGQFIPGFEEQLIGAEQGEDVTVEVQFPEDYQAEELAGEDAEFDVTIKAIRQIDLPELDDDFIMDISEFDTVEEYRADLKEKLEEQMKAQSEQALQGQLISKLSDLVDIEIPEGLVENQIDAEIEALANQFASQGMDPSMFDDMFQDPSMRDNFREQAAANVKNFLVLDQMVEQLDIELTDDELKSKIEEVADLYFGDDNEEMKENFVTDTLENRPEGMIDEFVKEKTLEYLMDKVTIKEITMEEAEEQAEAEAAESEEE